MGLCNRHRKQRWGNEYWRCVFRWDMTRPSALLDDISDLCNQVCDKCPQGRVNSMTDVRRAPSGSVWFIESTLSRLFCCQNHTYLWCPRFCFSTLQIKMGHVWEFASGLGVVFTRRALWLWTKHISAKFNWVWDVDAKFRNVKKITTWNIWGRTFTPATLQLYLNCLKS